MGTLNAELDEIRVKNLDTGDEFAFWESVTVSDEFLTPCQTFSLEAGSEMAGPDLVRKLPNGAPVQIIVNDKPQLIGWVDSSEISVDDHGGTYVTIAGRDILAPLVSGNIDPRMQVAKSTTIADLVKLVLAQYGLSDYTIFDGPVPSDVAIGTDTGKKKKYESRHAASLTIKDLNPQDNEGAFSYLTRILGHYGYWLWAAPDKLAIIVAGPDYDQKPSYTLTRKHDPTSAGLGKGNNVRSGRARTDESDVPSHVYVRGLDGSGSTKGAVVSMVANPLIRNFVPCYIRDKNAKTKEQAEVIARQFMAKKARNYFSYECTVAGFSDRRTGNVYNTNAVAVVEDEKCGVSGPLWIESRRFSKSRSAGTTTSMKLIPLGTLVLDWQPDETITGIKPFPDAALDVGKKAPSKTKQFVAGKSGEVTYGVSET